MIMSVGWWCWKREVVLVMMTSSNGNIFRVTGHLCGEFTGPGEFPAQRPVTRIFDVFFDLSLNKRLSKQSKGWWFETQSRPLWRHCNVGRMDTGFIYHTWTFQKYSRTRVTIWVASDAMLTEKTGYHIFLVIVSLVNIQQFFIIFTLLLN